MHLLDDVADRWRVVADLSPTRKRLFEIVVPKDATLAELHDFVTEVASILTRRREALAKRSQEP